MESRILYNDINLPEKVSDILELDFWCLEHVKANLVRTVVNPVKFSAATSIFVHQGECSADINLVNHVIKAPCIVNIGSGEIVLPKDVSDDFDASFVVVSQRMTEAIFSATKDTGLVTMLHSHPIVALDPDGVRRLERLYADLKDITENKDNPYIFNSILYTLLSYFFCNVTSLYDNFRRDFPASVNNRVADRFVKLVQEHFRRERFLEFYADKLGITTKHLSRTVKAQTGVSAVEWINRFVILEAKVMLRSSNLNIQQIAEELNFPSQSFFGKYFKKATGISPKDFRNSFS